MIVYILLCLCLPHLSVQQQLFEERYLEDKKSAKDLPERLVTVMQQYNMDARNRMYEMNEMRFMYEESPHYEYGYLMGEIVERYRKMVNHVKRPIEFQSDTLFPTLKRTELIQLLYFEIYHLVNMMHEVQRKYTHVPEFQNLQDEVDVFKMFEAEKAWKEQNKLESRDRKREQKLREKMREMAMAMGEKFVVAYNRTNKLWPLDYGWELSGWYW